MHWKSKLKILTETRQGIERTSVFYLFLTLAQYQTSLPSYYLAILQNFPQTLG